MSMNQRRQRLKKTQIFAQSQNVPQPILHSVNFHDQPRSSQEQNGNYPIFQQRKNNAKKNNSKNLSHHYAQNYFYSDDDEYYNQNHKRFSSNQRARSFSIDQPNFFEACTQNEHIGHPRTNPTPYNRNFQQQNPVNTHLYQPTHMHNEIPLPYYLQQHEITKSQSKLFSQMPQAAESLQMAMNPYLMGGSSITSNKPLMVFTGRDPEYSVEDYQNAVTTNLVLNIGSEPVNTPLHQNWIHRRTALIQTTLDGAAQKWFSVLPIDIKSDWKRFTQDFRKSFSKMLDETNNIKEYYAKKIVDYPMKQ